MFKGFAGLKKVVKGGFSAVAEHSSDLAERVISDPSTSTGHLKESLKERVANVVESSEQITTDSHAKETADEVAKVVHKVRHYGALGEDYLGYNDPTQDLRKAVKAKEKAAKKARKAKKKKTGKKEDLFDPENLAKYKAELDERKRREAEFAATQAAASGESDSDQEAVAAKADSQKDGNESDKSIQFTLDLAPTETSGAYDHSTTPFRSPLTPSHKEETYDWKLFDSLTSGVDSLIKQKKDNLEDIKQDSYYQRKKTDADSSPIGEQIPDNRKKKKGKKWVDLDQAGFDDFDGSVSGSDDEAEGDKQPEAQQEEKAEGNADDEEDNDDIGLVEIPEDDPIDLDAEEDIFNTAFVDAITSGDIKLAVIPDDPVYDDKDDPFNTEYADVIVHKDKVEKRKEANRLKFTGLSSVADVLSGKTDKVDKSLIEHSTKRKRRRANRINLIGELEEDLTAREDIGSVDPEVDPDQKDILSTTTAAEDSNTDQLDTVEVGNLLSSTPSPLPPSPAQLEAQKKESDKLIDLSEFDEVLVEEAEESLTSNVAILAGEFSKPIEEEEDDFDAAFDALAQESVTRTKLEELEKQFEEADVFDTTCADNILQLASLASKVEEVEEPLETFEDKDPFDTTAYEEITGELETDLDFDSLAKRGPESDEKEEKKEDDFEAWNEVKPIVDQGWAAFEETKAAKPSRPPPPRPAPPRPSETPQRPPRVYLDPESGRNTPSVVVKAPSTESIKSWNCSTADILIKKSEIEAHDAEILHEVEDEDDPFDTSNFEGVVPKEEEVPDPFDTTRYKSPEPEPQQDLLAGLDDEDLSGDSVLAPIASEADPFDTEFASGVLPDKGDPFDTSYIKRAPGKAEIRALEEEFLEKEDFDPRLAEGTQTPRNSVLPGQAGRVRPRGAVLQQLVVKQPEITEEEEEEDDPFDTTIVDKVIPVRKATRSSEISVEDENFDPTSTFLGTTEEIDPFDTSIAGQVIPELAEPKTEESVVSEDPEEESQLPQQEVVPEEALSPPTPPPEEPKKSEAPPPPPVLVDEIKRKSGRPRPRKPLPRQLTDEEFDPRS
jgi:hypothetical protein